MLIIKRKKDENIDRVLKKFKNKFKDAGISNEVRERSEYTKPSEEKRKKKLKAIYLNKKRNTTDG